MQEIIPGLQTQVSLKSYTSWQIGGVADYFALPANLEEMKSVCKWALENKVPVTILGGGSNVLIADRGIRGLTICMKKFTGVQVTEDSEYVNIIAMSGSGKNELLKVFLKNQLAPALFLAGLPGDIGGGVVMNAGVAESFVPREFGEIINWVEVLDHTNLNLNVKRLDHDEITWTYRHTEGWRPGIVVRVGIRYPKSTDPTILQKVKDANKIRLTKQPLDLPSCGSVFKNPPGHKAAQLIDSCGLKGMSFGGAQVSTKHANFIVNNGAATAKDVVDVISHVQKKVLQEKGVQLKTEVVPLGEWDNDFSILA